jgi:integrase-like protein
MKIAPESLRLLPLSEALDTWWEHVKEPTVRRPRTREAYLLYMKHLKRKMGTELLSQVGIGHLLEYQRERHKEELASVWLVNHETNTLSQLMRYADLWDRIGKYFKQLPPPEWTPPKVLSAEEEEHFFKIAAANPDWEVAYWALSLTNNTSAYGCELINLQRKHLVLDQKPPVMHVPDGKVKNEFRARVIPLNETALKQIERILGRAERLARAQGFTQLYAEHYILPRGVNRYQYDVTRPASRHFMYNHFYKMRKLTGFKWLCPRNFRNQIITKLFERGTPDETITSIAGHSSIKMSRYYSRIRVQAKFEALSALSPVGKKAKNAG